MSCGNCRYYQPDYGTWCMNGWTGDGSNGRCLLEPQAERVYRERPACRHWQGKDF